jgi:hypothetical protein
MDTKVVGVPEVALRLGVSLPTAHLALDKLGVPRTGRGRAREVPEDLVASLESRYGSTPTNAQLDRVDLKVLTAVLRAPLGAQSARAVAARAGVSPTTAMKALVRLQHRGFVSLKDTVVASGRARREARWFADYRNWPEEVRVGVHATVLPEPAAPRKSKLPHELHHLFWNATPTTLDPDKHGSYMAGRLLQAPDIRAWKWVMTNISREDISSAMSMRGFDKKIRVLVENWWANEQATA